jgi:opacity protein-like surface antigen
LHIFKFPLTLNSEDFPNNFNKEEIFMKLKNIILAFTTFALLVTAFPLASSAQTSIGASYEIRNEDPKNGFGVRLERGILQKIPVVNLGIRAHFSYFKEEIDRQNFSAPRDFTSYDYGAAGVVGVSVGPINPYAGLGLGSSTLDIQTSSGSIDDSSIYWNTFIGSKVSIIPKLKPFVEYRYESIDDFDDLGTSSTNIDTNEGRLIFGVSLSF